MKYFVIFLVLVGFAGTVYAEETFSGHSSIDPPISEITPRKTTAVNVLFQYTSGPYAITDLTPKVEITPQSATEYVKIYVEPIELNRGDIRRIPIMVTVDQDIPHEKIFLSISFSGKHFLTDSTFTSSWFESVTLDVAPKDVIGFDLGDCTPIEIDYEISGDKETIFCKSERTNSVKAFFDAKNNGTITLDIPKHILYGIGSTDCKLDNDFFVIYDGEEIAADIIEKDDSNLVSVDFESGIHEIEIIGAFIIPSPSPVQYCGIVENYPKTYLPPLDQIQHDMKPSQIRCNDGLVLLHKYDNSPACVTESTKQKLIERGWTKSNTTDESTTNLSFHENQDANELPSYRGISSSIQIPENASILSNKELDRTLEKLRHSGLPIVMSAIDYERGVIAIWTPDVSNEKPFKEHLGDIPFVLLYEETPPRWETGDPEPEPEPQSYDEAKLRDAQKALENAYFDTVNLGGFYIKDVIAGYGIYDNTLVIDIPARFMEPDSIKAIRQDVQSIVGYNVKIDYVLYDKPIERHIETVMPYWWSGFLNKQGIEYSPKNQTYWNNADGFHNPDKVCSSIIASNGTELYISSTFDLEPFQITGTFIDKKQPDNCHKIWKTEKILVEPDRVTMLWLKNQRN